MDEKNVWLKKKKNGKWTSIYSERAKLGMYNAGKKL